MGRGLRFGGIQPPVPVETPEDEGRMELANGDSIDGEVLGIDDGMIKLKTSLGEFSIPVARLRTLVLKPVELEQPKRRNGDVRAWFSDGTSMVFRLDDVKDGAFVGYSQTFGTAAFKIGAFRRIEFNIYNAGFDSKRSGEVW